MFVIDGQIITINGANVVKSDIATKTGGGLVHVVDRVLFPPTVGDVVQTLQVSRSPAVSKYFQSKQTVFLNNL